MFRWFTAQWYTLIFGLAKYNYQRHLKPIFLTSKFSNLNCLLERCIWVLMYPWNLFCSLQPKGIQTFFYLGCVWSLWIWPWICPYFKLYTMTLTNEWANMRRWAGLDEQERNLKAYSMPHHGIFLIYYFSTWILLNDVAKYSTTSWNIVWRGKIFCHITKYFVTW